MVFVYVWGMADKYVFLCLIGFFLKYIVLKWGIFDGLKAFKRWEEKEAKKKE